MSRKVGLDVARMCAIIPVLAVHYGAFAFRDLPPTFYALGDLGVEIFFALSGFLIGGIILRDFERGFSWRMALHFYARRWMRTLPLYYAFFAASAFVTIFGIKLDPEWSAKCMAYVLFLQNLAWPMLANWYHETWSLAIEEWFYLLFPLMFAALPGFTTRTRVLVIALALIVAPLALRIWLYDPASSLETDIRHVVALRLDAIAYGILAAWVVRSFPNARRWSSFAGVAGSLGFVVTLGAMAGKIPVGVFFLHTFSLSLSAASFAAIVFWADCQDWRSRIGFVTWFSTRSYALYLCHGCVVRTMLHNGWFAKEPIVSFLIFVSASLLLAEAAHRLVERPFMQMRDYLPSTARRDGSVTLVG
jgi:peptidoglycan/LPS O-acetylase OafA/YrhL